MSKRLTPSLEMPQAGAPARKRKAPVIAASTVEAPETDSGALAGEQRQAPRVAIAVMRAAKLVCNAGEYVCLLRDVSSGGVRLRLFHAFPEEPHALLEMSDGAVHPVIRVWNRDATAGFRFAQPIDTAAFLGEGRGAAKAASRPLALRVSAEGMVMASGIVHPVTLREIAQDSARLQIEGYLAIGQSLILSIPGLGERGGWIGERRGRDYTVLFETRRRLDDFALEGLALQPLPPREAAPQRGAA